MQIETFKIYCDIVKSKSFSKGAKINSVSQSMASHAVAQLEEYFNVKLINRSFRPWELTDSGQKIYVRLSHILDELRKTSRDLLSEQNTKVDIKLSSIYSVNFQLMQKILHQFGQTFPAACLTMEYCHPNKIIEQLKKDEIEIGVISYSPKLKDVQIIPWQSETFVLVFQNTEKNRCIFDKSLEHILIEFPLIHFEKGLLIRKEIDKMLKKYHLNSSVAFEFDNIEAIKRAVESGSGVAILPLPVLKNEIKSQTLIYKDIFDGGFSRPLNIICKKHNMNILESLIRMMLDLSKSDIRVPGT